MTDYKATPEQWAQAEEFPEPEYDEARAVTIPGYMLERRFIVGTLALNANADIAEKARQVLGLDESVTDCARFTAEFRMSALEFRQLLGGLSDQSLESSADSSSGSSD